MKEKLIDALGSLGYVLYFLLAQFVYVLPMVMIGKPFFLNVIFFFIMQVFPPASAVFWVWGLICAIQGVQDVFAIIFYIAFGIIFLPFFVSTVLSVFRK